MNKVDQHGFTLPEVLIAFAILSLSLTILYQTISTAARSQRAVVERTHALEIAETQLASLGTEVPSGEGERRGVSEDGRFRWIVTVTPLEDGEFDEARQNDEIRAYEVQIIVSWGAPERSRELSLSTLRLSPL